MAKEIVPTSCRLVGKGIKRIIHRFRIYESDLSSVLRHG